jgi:hypothetical protein
MYEEMRKYLVIYGEAVSHLYMTLHPIPSKFPYLMRKILFSFLTVQSIGGSVKVSAVVGVTGVAAADITGQFSVNPAQRFFT